MLPSIFRAFLKEETPPQCVRSPQWRRTSALGVGSCKGCEVAVELSNSKLWVPEMTRNFMVIVDCNAIMTSRIKVFNANRRVVTLYGCVSSLT